MYKLEYYIPSSDGETKLRVLEWQPECNPIGVIQISHGITEHMGRYEELAKFLVDRGFVVIGNDHIGHGKSISYTSVPMYFGRSGSWNYVIDDLYLVTKLIKNKYQNTKICLLGFSLGSYASRHYLIKYPNEMYCSILIGTGQTSFIENKIAELIVNWQIKKYGDMATTKVINQLTFGIYNKKYSKKIGYDWLCAHKPALNEYMNDPLRGGFMTTGLFKELLYGMNFTSKNSNIKKMNKNIPILFLSGKDDPVGNYTKGVIKAYKKFRNAGIKNVFYEFYSDMRHDILHEKNREIVFYDIYEYLKMIQFYEKETN